MRCAVIQLPDKLPLEIIDQLIVLFESLNRFPGCLPHEPAKYKNPDCQPDFPGACCLGSPPYQRQRQGPNTTYSNDNERRAEIPRYFIPGHGWRNKTVQKFAAMFTLYRFVLNLFGTKWALPHSSSFSEHTRQGSGAASANK